MNIISDNIDDIYLTLCNSLLHAPKVQGTRELSNINFTLTDINNNIVSVRDISPSYLFGELLWYFGGRSDVKFISKFSKMWEKLSDDGVTCNSAYGYLMREKYGFDQIQKIIELLEVDPLSRRAVINLNVPNENVIETKDEPCTIALQFYIRSNELHCTAMMRSNDIWFGLPYDVVFFTELQRYIANELRVQCGTYTHFATSLHLYDRNYERIKEIVDHPVSKKIKFNPSAFHDNAYFMTGLIEHSRNPKVDILKLFRQYGIYEEDKNEN